ncbi:ArsR family transcriptional regulator [Gluconacetobacter sacchari DSM 12717]|uniref:Winged helix-turn-helix transcriptional regulator n=2 Tax=Gluconacetobacter sacchari TaxID=92759 RepID=A0A7W4ICE9_9PROT|nr:metalloregulator ArsR/SmtB family transcription factor [Gluconacetobacter sacchari]MBB2160144.1 winged helix-turn-helix transcriptional regulator [Gluconacetobacter sacchari]GBQ22316.1 ArsR family transcriptional regulator [Gluconacetobacter sacchari DSM 12717]
MSGLTPDEAGRLAERLKLFAQPQRLRILSLLLGGARAVSVLESETGIGQPVLSQQLGALRRAGVLRCERESRSIVYSFQNDVEMERARGLLGLLEAPGDGRAASAWRRGMPATREEAGAVFARVEGREGVEQGVGALSARPMNDEGWSG